MKFINKNLSSFKLTGGIIWLLEMTNDVKKLDTKLANLRTLKKGTVGREVAAILDDNNYRLIPKFENHDLKHIVLEYEMTMQDEIKMQAYLMGNGNYTLPCLLFFSLGIFYPTTWRSLSKEFNLGRKTKSIHSLTLEDCKNECLVKIRNEFGRKIKSFN
ncbi:hypothetical protein GKZ90_0022015 [Flavobacterium sp. MC2016-06]|jgi:ubiquinone biosynthesis protein Coq4|uniref:hypothetical protein n=1 Tax=Flavobacterium sp. MC2016-06 TaxID=2676308 RepID=UPI0012BAEA9A|nr:hypothetical protein [Flavobacterium sp. MC2016-06]MBU3861117.1 hypothetical protein [Flavobacterium sp. MC2016-06]